MPLHPALHETTHRPWPLPVRDWCWRQSWLDLAFIHYRVTADSIRKRLPVGLRLQEYDGSAWVGLVPFRMSGVMRRPFPDVPAFGTFPELNLRTYVEAGGKPGVWFFSLDATSWPIVLGGRHLYDLPYFPARMSQTWRNDRWLFTSQRRGGRATFAGRYRPIGESFRAAPGTFEYWATERYCLYSHSARRGLRRVEVHHAPWPLQAVELEIEECTLLATAGIAPTEPTPVCHFSTGVHVVSYLPERVN